MPATGIPWPRNAVCRRMGDGAAEKGTEATAEARPGRTATTGGAADAAGYICAASGREAQGAYVSGANGGGRPCVGAACGRRRWRSSASGRPEPASADDVGFTPVEKPLHAADQHRVPVRVKHRAERCTGLHDEEALARNDLHSSLR